MNHILVALVSYDNPVSGGMDASFSGKETGIKEFIPQKWKRPEKAQIHCMEDPDR
jgi:hypothetical protein